MYFRLPRSKASTDILCKLVSTIFSNKRSIRCPFEGITMLLMKHCRILGVWIPKPNAILCVVSDILSLSEKMILTVSGLPSCRCYINTQFKFHATCFLDISSTHFTRYTLVFVFILFCFVFVFVIVFFIYLFIYVVVFFLFFIISVSSSGDTNK